MQRPGHNFHNQEADGFMEGVEQEEQFSEQTQLNHFNGGLANQIRIFKDNTGKFTTMQRNSAVEMDKCGMPIFTGESEESSWPRLEVQELSDYVHEN